jgi:hypothetical protein
MSESGLRNASERSMEIGLTVTGKKSGKELSRPVWFVYDANSLYLLPVQGRKAAWKILAYDGILEVMKNSAWKIRGIMTELLMTQQNRSVLRLPSGRPIIRIMR